MEIRNILFYELFQPVITEVTAKGISYNNKFYSCRTAISQQWFLDAMAQKWNVLIYIDPITDDYILVQVENDFLSIAYKIDNDLDIYKKEVQEYYDLINNIKKQLKQRKRSL